MKSEEIEGFTKFSTNYEKYMKENPNSLISKIYGIFSFNFVDF
jgi:hypothetical protein